MGFSSQSQKRIADVVRQVERSPINEGTGKRSRRFQAGISAKFFQVKKAINGDEFLEYADYQNVSSIQKYSFTCAPVKRLNGSKLVAEIETDEEKWVNVFNLSREWIPVETLVEAWNIKGDWYCHHQRAMPPTLIVQGTASVAEPTYDDFELNMETCSLGRIQYEIEENEADITLSISNYAGRYIDDGFKCVAIGYPSYQSSRYYDRDVDLYGESYTDILADYDFTLIDAGCG